MTHLIKLAIFGIVSLFFISLTAVVMVIAAPFGALWTLYVLAYECITAARRTANNPNNNI